MSNVVQRILLFLVGIPVIIALILLFPEPNHLVLNIVVLIVSILASFESFKLFRIKIVDNLSEGISAILLGGLLPGVSLLITQGQLQFDALFIALVTMIIGIFFIQVFRPLKEFDDLSPSIGRTLAALIYPGLFFAHVILLSRFEHASALYLIFLASVFFNDTMAYVGGMLFGRKSTKVTPISPNKSLVGFIVGYIFSPGCFAVGYFLIPDAFPSGLLSAIIIGVVIGISTISGDLIESALKRSSHQKDSGEIIPGRGGFLDSLDSVIFSAPFFYYLYLFLNQLPLLP
jgi:phosphatidate cytidylyltransferase